MDSKFLVSKPHCCLQFRCSEFVERRNLLELHVLCVTLWDTPPIFKNTAFSCRYFFETTYRIKNGRNVSCVKFTSSWCYVNFLQLEMEIELSRM